MTEYTIDNILFGRNVGVFLVHLGGLKWQSKSDDHSIEMKEEFIEELRWRRTPQGFQLYVTAENLTYKFIGFDDPDHRNVTRFSEQYFQITPETSLGHMTGDFDGPVILLRWDGKVCCIQCYKNGLSMYMERNLMEGHYSNFHFTGRCCGRCGNHFRAEEHLLQHLHYYH